MAIAFAWPICHGFNGQYPTIPGNFARGRRFRQAVLDPAATDVVDGLELWLKDVPAHTQVYACFEGMLRYLKPRVVGQVALPATLRLELSTKLIKEWVNLAALNAVEPPPKALYYMNVKNPKAALVKIIYDAYIASKTTPQLHHPSFDWVHMADLNSSGVEKPIRLKPYLEEFIEGRGSDVQLFLGNLIDSFIAVSGDPGVERFQLPVLPGDLIGEIDTNTALPAPAGLGPSPRYFLFKVEDRCDRTRNPSYDLWTWLNAAQKTPPGIQLLAPSDFANHPLVKVQQGAVDEGALKSLSTPKPPPRVKTLSGKELRPIALHDLKDWGGHFLPAGTTKFKHSLEWRVLDDRRFEARIRAGQTGVVLPDLNPAPEHHTRVAAMWNAHKTHILDMSRAFQVPVDNIIASMCIESGNAPSNVNGAALEPIDDGQRLEKDKAVLSDPAYQQAIARYKPAVPGTQFGLKVPTPWDGSLKIFSGMDLSWDDIALLMQKSEYMRGRVSVGLLQTLISTAIDMAKKARLMYPELRELDPARYGQPEWYLGLGLGSDAPAAPADYLKDWLLQARRGICLGVVFKRVVHNGIRFATDKATGIEQISSTPTCWDPLKDGVTGKAGSVQASVRAADARWGIASSSYFDNAPHGWCRYYNAAVELLNAAQDDLTVRLGR